MKNLVRGGPRYNNPLGHTLEKLLVGMELTGKVKIGVSGCPNNCGEGYVRNMMEVLRLSIEQSKEKQKTA